MKTGKTLQQLAIEIERQNEVKRDYIANTSQMNMQVTTVYDGEKERRIPVLSLEGKPDFRINGVAHDQIGNKVGIPSRYYDRMLADEPELLAKNVNTWFQKEPSNRMVRTLDGTTRAFLSEKYRRLDNHDIAQAVLPMIANFDGAS